MDYIETILIMLYARIIYIKNNYLKVVISIILIINKLTVLFALKNVLNALIQVTIVPHAMIYQIDQQEVLKSLYRAG